MSRILTTRHSNTIWDKNQPTNNVCSVMLPTPKALNPRRENFYLQMESWFQICYGMSWWLCFYVLFFDQRHGTYQTVGCTSEGSQQAPCGWCSLLDVSQWNLYNTEKKQIKELRWLTGVSYDWVHKSIWHRQQLLRRDFPVTDCKQCVLYSFLKPPCKYIRTI